MRRLLLANAVILSLTACGSFPFGRARPDSESTQPHCGNDEVRGTMPRGHADLELRDIHYNGDTLEGVLLISAVGGPLCFDQRLIPGWDVTLDWVWDCSREPSEPVASLVIHSFPRPSSEGHVLLLEPGYWYGGPISLPLFMSETPVGKRNPECVEVSLSLLSLKSGPAGRVRARAWREPPTMLDGGVPSDGGVTPQAAPSPDDVSPGRVWVPFRDSQ